MKYNSDINIIGGIPDYHLIYRALPLLIKNPDELKRLLVIDNEFNFRTEKSRKRFLAVLNSAFISDNKQIDSFLATVIKSLDSNEQAQAIILFWLFSINNTLFYELNRDVFLKSYFQGRAELPKNDIIAFLKDIFSRKEGLKGKWSEKTINVTSSKYLTLLKKLYLLEGRQKKTFHYIQISDELLTVFIYLSKLLENSPDSLLEDDFLAFSFVSGDSLLDRLKKIANKGWLNMSYTGNKLIVETNIDYNKLANVIYNRA